MDMSDPQAGGTCALGPGPCVNTHTHTCAHTHSHTRSTPSGPCTHTEIPLHTQRRVHTDMGTNTHVCTGNWVTRVNTCVNTGLAYSLNSCTLTPTGAQGAGSRVDTQMYMGHMHCTLTHEPTRVCAPLGLAHTLSSCTLTPACTQGPGSQVDTHT